MKELVYHRFLLPTIERLPAKTAVLDGDYSATFEQHLDRVLRLGDALRAAGVSPGDRFAVMALNGHQFLELYHASLLTGAVINPLNLRLAPKELEFILSDSGCQVCFADGFFGAAIDKVRDAAGLEKLVLIGAGDVPHDLAYEDMVSWGYGAEIAARIADELFEDLDAPVRRIAAMDTFVAYQPILEDAILPQPDAILKAIVSLKNF